MSKKNVFVNVKYIFKLSLCLFIFLIVKQLKKYLIDESYFYKKV